jgi:hypothetical protein
MNSCVGAGIKKGSISRLINTTGTAQATYSVELNAR